MNYRSLVIILLVVTGLLIFALNFTSCGEKFTSFVRKPASNQPIQLGFLKNTPGPLKDIITEIQKLGSQLTADTEYDQVATDYLDPSNVG